MVILYFFVILQPISVAFCLSARSDVSAIAQQIPVHAEPCEAIPSIKAGIGWDEQESRHFKKASSCVLSLTLGNLASYQMILSRARQQRCPRDVFIRIPLPMFTQYLCDSIKVLGLLYSYRRGLSALLVQQYRAMQEPPGVG